MYAEYFDGLEGYRIMLKKSVKRAFLNHMNVVDASNAENLIYALLWNRGVKRKTMI